MLVNATKFSIDSVASFDVDAQNTFTELCPLELPVKGGQDIVPELNAQAKFAKVRVGSKDAHSPASLWVDSDKEPQFTPIADALNMDIRWKIHGVPGSAGFRLIDGLPAVKDYDFFVWKGIDVLFDDSPTYGRYMPEGCWYVTYSKETFNTYLEQVLYGTRIKIGR